MPTSRRQPTRRSWSRAPLIALALAASASPALAQDVTRTTLDGVYTPEEAERGAQTYKNICSQCHEVGAPPLRGQSFISKWQNKSLYQLWGYFSTQMPFSAPGTLTPEEYLGMLAWLLRENGYPAGTTPLPTENLNGVYYRIGEIMLVPKPATPK